MNPETLIGKTIQTMSGRIGVVLKIKAVHQNIYVVIDSDADPEIDVELNIKYIKIIKRIIK